MSGNLLTWEETIRRLKSNPGMADLVKACYYDEPLLAAARRFAASEEWQATWTLISKWLPGEVCDLGAGHGITSYALAQGGCRVTTVEPDPSVSVGARAIKGLANEAGVAIKVVQAWSEALPFHNGSFDLVYGRQVLHHAADLLRLCQEAARVLRPGGGFLATREHVISRREDLPIFLKDHPLHAFYGGENAFVLKQYLQAMHLSGLRLKKVYGPMESVINYYPMTYAEYREKLSRVFARVLGQGLAQHVASQKLIQALAGRYLSTWDKTPGRLYSFLAIKPKSL